MFTGPYRISGGTCGKVARYKKAQKDVLGCQTQGSAAEETVSSTDEGRTDGVSEAGPEAHAPLARKRKDQNGESI